MRTLKIGFTTAIISLGFLVLSSYGADIAKIGVFDFQRILETSDAGKSAQAEVKKAGGEKAKHLEKKKVEIDELEKRLKREALVMSRQMREEKEREVRIKANDFKMLQNKYRAELKELDFKILKRIRQELFEIVEEMGKKEGYLLILEKREGGVLYYPAEIDITDTLVRKYNAKKAEKSN